MSYLLIKILSILSFFSLSLSLFLSLSLYSRFFFYLHQRKGNMTDAPFNNVKNEEEIVTKINRQTTGSKKMTHDI